MKTSKLFSTRFLFLALTSITIVLFLSSCGSKRLEDSLIIREMADAEKLNPTVSNDASASEIDSYIYETLSYVDNVTYDLIPYVAELPTESPNHLSYTYNLRKNVKFSDGHELTGEDVIFSLKAIKNLYADDAALRNYFEMIKSAELVNGDKYTVKFNLTKPYWRSMYTLGLFAIMPKHILDPEGLNDKIKFEELENYETAKGNPNIQKYADFLNSPDVSRNPKYVIGSGPYKLQDWKTGQEIRLVRNDNYWYSATIPENPKFIIFKTVNDNSAALVGAKNKDVDAMFVIPPADFYKNLENPDQFALAKAKPVEPTYSYLTYNEKNILFQDKKVRMALAYLVDRNTIIEKILYNDATPIQSHIFYKNTKYLNDQLPPIPYDPEKAKKMLSEAGWKMNDQGVLEKVIDGKKTEFKFTFLSNNNSVRKQIILVVIDAMKKVGIQAGLQDLEWSVYLDKTKKHEFDATYASWQLSVTPEDPYQIWHSSQAEGQGSNIESFINKTSDSLIEAYRVESDEAKRIELLKKWQQLIYDEQPYTFLWSAKSRYIYDTRINNVKWYDKAPSPQYNEWQVPKLLGAVQNPK